MSDTTLELAAEGAPPPVVAMPAPLRLLSKAVDWAVISMGAVMIALIFANVVLHAFSKDLAWVTELGEFMMVWVTFLGGVCAAQRGAHMSINEFLDKLQPAGRRLADMAVQGVCIVVLGILLFYGYRIVAASWDNTLTTLLWPMAWQYMPLPIGAGLMLVFTAWDFVLTLRGVPRDQRYPSDD
jgi:TRAP-type C4-dicarboxylate transport system permease small subunit